jgi:hypothetical protein
LPRASLALGNYHALVIGNDDYRTLPRLNGAAEGAREVARILKDEYGFHVHLLTNASRYDVLAALNDLRQRLDDKDNLLIYYAGHGQADPAGQGGYWLPVDGEAGQPASWIANTAITDFLSAMNVRQVLVATDACYSGTLSGSAVASADRSNDQARLTYIQAVARRRSRVLMAGGRCEPLSSTSRMSSFTRSFIEVLQSNGDVLAGQELFALLRTRIAMGERPETAGTLQYAPIRYAGHEAGDFVFARNTRN